VTNYVVIVFSLNDVKDVRLDSEASKDARQSNRGDWLSGHLTASNTLPPIQFFELDFGGA